MTPRVSVLIPARNASGTIGACLSSLAKQTLEDFEIVLVDDDSTDDTLGAAMRALPGDERLRFISEGRLGLVGALNLGLRQCRAPLIARLDADDLARPDRLSLQEAMATSSPEISIIGGRVASFGENGAADEGYRVYDAWLNSLCSHDEMTREIFVESPLAHPSVTYRRDAILRLGGYRDVAWPEDYDLWLRAVQAGLRLVKVPEVVLDWRDTPNRASRVDPRYGRDAFLECKAHYLRSGPLASRSDVVIWGAGKMGRRLSRLLAGHGIETLAFVDIDPRKIENGRRSGPSVLCESELGELRGKVLLGAVASRGARDEIRSSVVGRGWIEGLDFFCVA